MATIGGLGRTIATATGIPAATVAVTARELRRSRILTSSGKGFAASEMTPGDAASLLLATIGSDSVKETPRVAKKLAALPGKKAEMPVWARGKFVSELENQLGAAPSLIWSLVWLLQLCAAGRVFPDWSGNFGSIPPRSPDITISLFKPVLAASIEISANRFFIGYRYGALAGIETERGQDLISAYEQQVVAPRYPRGFVVRTARIGMKSVMEVAMSISQDKSHGAR